MIIFLSFAPIEFMGGAERWFYSTAKFVSKNEKVAIINVSPIIANIYGRIVLHRTFNTRIPSQDIKKHMQLYSITPQTFIPFTKNWHEVRQVLQKARKVYIKFEVLELFLLLYFGGLHVLSKVIAGIHTPYLYPENEQKEFFNKVHNITYKSSIIRSFMSKLNTVHVLTKRDKDFFEKKFQLKNVIYIPNGVPIVKNYKDIQKKDTKNIHILFVGELILRKGVDRLCNVIQKSPSHFIFHICGDGPMKSEIEQLSTQYSNVHYYGYLPHDSLAQLYKKSTVLFLPSRAESMSFVVLEALSYGVCIVDSKDVALNLPKEIEYTNHDSRLESYIAFFKQLKKTHTNNEFREKVRTYFKNNYSIELINNQLAKQLFDTR